MGDAVNAHDRALAVTLRAAQWLLDDVADSMRRGKDTPRTWRRLGEALEDLTMLVREHVVRLDQHAADAGETT